MPHLLVVDDDLSMREMLEVMLTSEGYDLEYAENGAQAIELLKETEYDLILCDIRMEPVGGLDVLREAKSRQPQTVVIMISAFATTETAVEAMKEGINASISKP